MGIICSKSKITTDKKITPDAFYKKMSSTDGESTVISNEDIYNYYKIEGKPIGLIININYFLLN